jgi:hypothetical protein
MATAFRCVIAEMVKAQDGVVIYVVTGAKPGLAPFKALLIEAESLSEEYSVGLSAALLDVVETKTPLPRIADLGASRFAPKRSAAFGAAAEALQQRLLHLMEVCGLTCISHTEHEDKALDWIDAVDSFLLIEGVY